MSTTTTTSPSSTTETRARMRQAGVLAEFDSEERILRAAAKARDAGYVRWDVHTPYPVHGMDDAMGIRQTILPWIVLGAGLTGVTFATLLQWWMNAYDYPYLISGKPFWSLPANVPIMFELMVLFSGLTAFGAMMGLNWLPAFYIPQFRSTRFRRVTSDRYFVWIDARDRKFAGAAAFLQTLEPDAIEIIEEENS